MHFPLDHSPHFKCICTNCKSEVGKNFDNTSCGLWYGFFLVQSEEVWRRAPSPVQHQSMASPLAHPAQFSTTSRVVLHSQALLFSLIHILSVLNTTHAAHFSGGKNSPKKCIVLDSPPKRLHWLMCAKCHCLGEWETGSQTHSSFPTPST